ncbi:hypothetical protein RHMOL_Rhmol10G0267200 [Rhododendron molle]|uniref:Uncharacterized protein n=1 Tax=Rhododendron molle TaxID=49168 RepID=A0ACC0M6N5_RHOML|nr:hypothetical protein RHMOL_Rhmol10G0267200 [Rhododendron molle]
MTTVTIESDFLSVVKMINEGNSVNQPQSVMISDAHAILDRTESMLTHLYQEANQFADHLARIGAEQDEDLMFFGGQTTFD